LLCSPNLNWENKIMALTKLPKGSPFNNIWKWLWQRRKIFIPNPMTPAKTKTTEEQKINATHLQKLLMKTHAPNGKINKIIDEVNKLIKRVAKNEKDIKRLGTTKSKKGHGHSFAGTGAVLPSTSKKGGVIEKMQYGGNIDCPDGQHWMPAKDNKPGYCMEGESHSVSDSYSSRGIYGEGDIISEEHLNIIKSTCYAGNGYEVNDDWKLADWNGATNGGHYNVIFIDLSTTW
jgi:hypothetical protein